ncbi:MAG TPA: hypothetical protein VKU41_27125, partial [Polyangiaceae bacterium]|nr:hypothetical protein [Polyangiaceae bacterium]
MRRWVPRFALAALIGGSAVVAWREGGGADPRTAVPHAGSTPARDRDGERALGAEAFEIRARLVDAIGDARIDVPALAAARPYFQAYWRKVPGPWTRASGLAGQLVATTSLRNGTKEKQWTVATSDGNTWTPEARVWNMNEGSYDQREALYAPTPATLVFRTTLPPGAFFRVAPAVMTPLPATTVFEVTVVDAAGTEFVMSRTRIGGADAGRWREVEIDLSAWGGETIDLRLRTTTDRPSADEKIWSPKDEPADPDPGDPAAAAEPAPVPPMALALWGDPIVVAKEPTRLPYNVLWIVVDALRPDVAALLHDPAEDAQKRAAKWPPLEALLPAVP